MSTVKTYGWLNPEKLKFINDNPKVLSLLYDLGLLPEEISARIRGYVEEETKALELKVKALEREVGAFRRIDRPGSLEEEGRMVVREFPLTGDDCVIAMPEGSSIIGVKADQAVLWAVVDPRVRTVFRRFRTIPTEGVLERRNHVYLGTYTMMARSDRGDIALALHVFWDVGYQKKERP